MTTTVNKPHHYARAAAAMEADMAADKAKGIAEGSPADQKADAKLPAPKAKGAVPPQFAKKR